MQICSDFEGFPLATKMTLVEVVWNVLWKVWFHLFLPHHFWPLQTASLDEGFDTSATCSGSTSTAFCCESTRTSMGLLAFWNLRYDFFRLYKTWHTIWNTVILLMEEIRLTSWNGKYLCLLFHAKHGTVCLDWRSLWGICEQVQEKTQTTQEYRCVESTTCLHDLIKCCYQMLSMILTDSTKSPCTHSMFAENGVCCVLYSNVFEMFFFLSGMTDWIKFFRWLLVAWRKRRYQHRSQYAWNGTRAHHTFEGHFQWQIMPVGHFSWSHFGKDSNLMLKIVLVQ